MMTMMEVQMNS